MTKFLKTAGYAGMILSGAIAATSVAQAAGSERTAREGQGIVTMLGTNVSAVTYWISQPDGWHVVTTVDTIGGRDSDTENHAIVRFSAVLSPGQVQSISVPVTAGETQPVLQIRRVADRIEIEQQPVSSY
jgi:hypothetical protein